MTEGSATSASAARPSPGPFAIFGVVAVIAAVGAVFEISYWVGVSATAPGVIGTAVGIAAALVGFFAWGLWAPPNE